MERAEFQKLSTIALEHIEENLAELEHDTLDVDLAADVLTIDFGDGTKFIINAHSAAGQIWMAADRNAWHFDFVSDGALWVARKTEEELMKTVARTVGAKLGMEITL